MAEQMTFRTQLTAGRHGQSIDRTAARRAIAKAHAGRAYPVRAEQCVFPGCHPKTPRQSRGFHDKAKEFPTRCGAYHVKSGGTGASNRPTPQVAFYICEPNPVAHQGVPACGPIVRHSPHLGNSSRFLLERRLPDRPRPALSRSPSRHEPDSSIPIRTVSGYFRRVASAQSHGRCSRTSRRSTMIGFRAADGTQPPCHHAIEAA